ncbi:MAG: hypothetical protein U9Q61_07725 [Thermodesulfobacteriota bacterium]|nr:hypothetical protein [Thermodesulfobacteriota bacterium]
MEMLIPALIIFLLAFTGLSIGIICGRKGISGSCSSEESKLLDIQCFCGQDSNCAIGDSSNTVFVAAVCANGDMEKCREIQAEFEKKTGK